jgi:hypothetical protein
MRCPTEESEKNQVGFVNYTFTFYFDLASPSATVKVAGALEKRS